MLRLKIGETDVEVDWEENASVAALSKLCASAPLVVRASKYGGNEQVGSLGATLPSDDKRVKTAPGDIVLYCGDQIVIFYGSNTWSYTRLGRVSDRDASEMTKLLGRDDVALTLSVADE